MREEIGIGIVGLGWMGQFHSRGYRRLFDHYPDCALKPRLVIAADAVEDRARESAGFLEYEDWTTDWREVIEHPDVEAVSIAAPNYLHREVAVAAARAGKHIWLEKPCGRLPAETFEIGDTINDAGESDWLERFPSAYALEMRRWIENLHAGKLTGPDAWDGYISLLAVDACAASLRSGEKEPFEAPERPDLYR